MKRVILGVVFAALMVVPVLAAKKMKRDMMIPRDCQVQGRDLKAGNYTVEFNDAEPGELVVSEGKKEVARTSYKIVELPKAASSDIVVFNTKDGIRKIARIEMKGSKSALSLD
jgi:hypothetical protein